MLGMRSSYMLLHGAESFLLYDAIVLDWTHKAPMLCEVIKQVNDKLKSRCRDSRQCIACDNWNHHDFSEDRLPRWSRLRLRMSPSMRVWAAFEAVQLQKNQAISMAGQLMSTDRTRKAMRRQETE